MSLTAASPGSWRRIALFPLGSVLFPDGLLGLKVFEARYLDLVSTCLREGTDFGVVTLTQGSEVRGGGGGPVSFESIGCMARLLSCDSEQAGILQVRCCGTRRFEQRAGQQRPDGLWTAEVRLLDADAVLRPDDSCAGAVASLGRAVQALAAQGQRPFLEPYRYDDAGWVANRWCEILPIPLATRHKLMALPDPAARLQLVNGFLKRHGIG